LASTYISFNHISFAYSEEGPAIINDFSFELSYGDRMVIEGDSGMGKTTLFRLLLGFEQPDEGQIFYKNQPLDSKTIHQFRKETAWLPQDLNLGTGPVEGIIQFLFDFETNKATRPGKAKITDTFKKLGLQPALLEKNMAELSTGQRQRVGIAICHLLEKPLILLDEPTSALDQTSKKKVSKLIFDHPERTVLSVSHDPWWIDQCDSVIELNH